MEQKVEPEQIAVGADDILAWEHSLREYLALPEPGNLVDLHEMLSALAEWLSTTYQDATRVGHRDATT